MKKKILTILICMAMVLNITACGESENSSTSVSGSTPGETASTNPTGTGSVPNNSASDTSKPESSKPESSDSESDNSKPEGSSLGTSNSGSESTDSTVESSVSPPASSDSKPQSTNLPQSTTPPQSTVKPPQSTTLPQSTVKPPQSTAPSTPAKTVYGDFEILDTGSAITILKYIGSVTDVVIPSEINAKPVTVIGEDAFYDLTASSSIVTSITIPESVVEIGSSAFDCCRKLTSINLPAGLKKIGRDAFECCEKLKKITLTPENTLPSGLKEIPEYLFAGSDSLESVIIPDGVTSIGEGAFRNCGSISVQIPDSVTSIADGAFYYSKGCHVSYKGKTYTYSKINDLYAAINGN